MHPTSDTFYYKGIKVHAEWYPQDYVPQHKVISQVSGACFRNDGKLLVVTTHKGKAWIIPGGKPEKNETFQDTLAREVREEASVDIIHPKILGYVKNQFIDEKGYHVVYQLRCAAMVRKIHKMEMDPDAGVVRKRRFVDPKNFDRYIHWGKLGQELMRGAKLYLEEQKRNKKRLK